MSGKGAQNDEGTALANVDMMQMDAYHPAVGDHPIVASGGRRRGAEPTMRNA
jgi:hypothetical protein